MKGWKRSPPSLSVSLTVSLSLLRDDCRLSTRLLFHLLLLSLPQHIIFFFFCDLITFLSLLMIEYLTMKQFIPHSLQSFQLFPWFIVSQRCGAGALRKAEEGHN